MAITEADRERMGTPHPALLKVFHEAQIHGQVLTNFAGPREGSVP